MKYLKWALPLALLWSALAFAFVAAGGPPDPSDPPESISPYVSPPIIAAWIQRTRVVPGPMSVIVAPNISAYNELSPHSYTIERDGSLTVNNPVADQVLMDYARSNNVRYIPTVSTGWDNGSRLLTILRDPVLRADHIEAIMRIARQPSVDGIDLDYENLPPESRALYTTFVTELAAALHQDGRLLSVTVPPVSRADDPCVFCKFADYAAIGAAADRFRVMAYEYHGKSGGPGPVAPVWWVRDVMSYTVSVVPHDKVSIGIHLYAYDWGGDDTPAMWWADVEALKQIYGGVVTYPDDARGEIGEGKMTYTVPIPVHCVRGLGAPCPPPVAQKHTVWFVDSHYVEGTLKIVQDLGLAGVVMWRPGGEDPAIWNVLAPTSLSPSPRYDQSSPF